MRRNRRWTVAPTHADAAELARRLKTSPIIAQVLLNRGIREPDECQRFLQPSLKALHEPGMIPNIERAADRIARAIRDRQKIVIYGDYDVDGITATAILWHAIRLLGGNVEYYIPHRLDEGYGLNAAAITEICDGGAQLIVSVDCGVTATEPAKVAQDRGVDLIITDHHEWHTRTNDHGARDPILPDAYAVVHPRLPTDHDGNPKDYPNPHLCGAGVAFKLAWAIGQAVSGNSRVSDEFREFLVDATALAALGTIADVVPLVGENRILARYGLGGLQNTRLHGIRALIASANLTGTRLDSYHIGFLLAPRLNACGRMGHARLAVEMLTSADEQRAMEIAQYLEQQNRQRQQIERQILDSAMAQVAERKMNSDDCRAIVLGSEQWHAGVIGIVASRLVDRYCRPAILVSFSNGTGQGSGRSINGFHLAQALEACGELLEGYGGHEMAAGLKVKPENFEQFRRMFCDYATRTLEPEQLVPILRLDADTELRQVTMDLVGDLRRLAPFGRGNRTPLLCIRGVELAGPPRRVGKTGDHLQLFLRQNGATMKAIAFGGGELFDQLRPGVMLDLAIEPMLNHFNGRTSVELEVKDLKLCEP